ncbi:MAG: hypothetical protein DRI48_11270 [Chloroflexi bacterium]|nr:MAG: hypothetical protein DRI48_11270 [Chloroflexota bacterium]
MKALQKRADFATHLGRVIIFFALAVVVVALLVAHVLAWRWSRAPFLGMLLEPTLVLSPLQGRGWARLQFDPPLGQPDHLIAIDGQLVERYADVAAILGERAVGILCGSWSPGGPWGAAEALLEGYRLVGIWHGGVAVGSGGQPVAAAWLVVRDVADPTTTPSYGIFYSRWPEWQIYLPLVVRS